MKYPVGSYTYKYLYLIKFYAKSDNVRLLPRSDVLHSLKKRFGIVDK